MNNYQNNGDSAYDIQNSSKMQFQFNADDLYNYGVTDTTDGFYYMLIMHKINRMLIFSRSAENVTQSLNGGH